MAKSCQKLLQNDNCCGSKEAFIHILLVDTIVYMEGFNNRSHPIEEYFMIMKFVRQFGTSVNLSADEAPKLR